MMKMPTAGYKSHTFPDMASQISTESLAAMEIIKFPGKIVTVNTENEAFSAVENLRKESVVGIDTETRPSFKKGVIHSVALVQISTWDVCYLFRICRMKSPLLHTVLPSSTRRTATASRGASPLATARSTCRMRGMVWAGA